MLISLECIRICNFSSFRSTRYQFSFMYSKPYTAVIYLISLLRNFFVLSARKIAASEFIWPKRFHMSLCHNLWGWSFIWHISVDSVHLMLSFSYSFSFSFSSQWILWFDCIFLDKLMHFDKHINSRKIQRRSNWYYFIPSKMLTISTKRTLRKRWC